MSDDKPKLTIVGADQPAEEKEAPKVIPCVVTQAAKVIHPIFQDPQTGQPLPPPPDHELRVGVQVSITGKGRVVTEGPGLFFASGDDPQEVADMIRDVILDGLEEVKKANMTIQPAPESALKVLDRFGEKH